MEEERPTSREHARLTTLRLFGASEQSEGGLLGRLAEYAAAAFGVRGAIATAIGDDGEEITAVSGIDPVEAREASFPFSIESTLRAPSGEKIGTLALVDERPRAFTPANVSLFEQLAFLVAERLACDRESRSAAAMRDKLHAILQASPFAIITTRFDGRITTWNDGAERLFGWTSQETLGLTSPVLPPELAPQSQALRARVARGEVVRAMRTYRYHKDGRRMEIDLSAAPLRGPRGHIVGGVYILEDVTAVLRERENERNRYEILELAANDAPLQILLDRLVANVERAIPGTTCTVLRVANGRLRHAAAGAEMPPSFVAAVDGVEIGPNVGSCGAAAATNEMVIVDDLETHPNWESVRDLVRGSGLGACWSVPINGSSGVIATMAAYARVPRKPDEAEVRVLSEAAHVASIVLEGHDTRAKLRAMALHDPLTGLANRALFEECLESAIARAKGLGRGVAIGLLDLDRFKVVNDSLGHAVGDRLLQEVANRLQRSLRAEDTVARMGGDEFMLLIGNVDDRASASAVLQRCLASLRPSFSIDGTELFLRASLGLSMYPEDAAEPSQLIRLADRAMYEAKTIGSAVVFHDGERPNDGLTELELETYLHHAVENDEFELAYQPIVDLTDGNVSSAEALLRWTHPKLGRLAPDRFIALAEETGLIVPIGAWVLKEACRFSKRWTLAGGSGRVAVNVSPRQFEDRAFVQTVIDAVRESGIAPSNLCLEITEGLIMRSPETVAGTLAELRSLGVRSAIDDFGSGYSSLGYLKRFPIEALKIDRTFVSEIGTGEASASDAAIIHAIVAVGDALGLAVVAEGVETESQASFLRDAGCGFAQGYLFARPLAGSALVTMSRSGATPAFSEAPRPRRLNPAS